MLVLSLVMTSFAGAQYGNPWWTSYQVVNMGDGPADIVVDYYDTNGDKVAAATKQFLDVPVGGSRLVTQFDDSALGTGRFSAVISADEPIAAIANQELAPSGQPSYNPEPPFSTYSGQSEGATKITLPAVMYNWYGYYTEIFIQNVGSADAADVDITYVPGEMDVGSGPEDSGAFGVTDLDNTIPQYASIHVSQETLSSLGAPSGSFTGRFLGSAVLTSDQPIIAVVNQHNTGDYKLMTYNGFAGGSMEIAAPSYMRGYYGYYTTLLIANPDETTTANVDITYAPNTTESFYNEAAPGSTIGVVEVSYAIPPQTALTRYDGPPATDGQSDLDDHDTTGHAYTKFFGSVTVESDIDVMVQVNVEAEATGDAQGGAYNGISLAEASQDVVAPVILADFYGYYTTMVVQNTIDTAGTCHITYTSDDTYSARPNESKTYEHALPASGSFTVYEGRKGGQEVGDINSDTDWRLGGQKQFIGAASLSCTVPVVAFVNEESDITMRDSMYTMNTFNK
jgi:hypothetical protein